MGCQRCRFNPWGYYPTYLGFPAGSDGKESTCNVEDLGSTPGFGKIPWRRAWQPTPVFLPGESPWTEEPGGLHGPWGHKESATTERLSTAQHIHQQKCFNLGYSVIIMWTSGVFFFFFGLVILNLEINFFNVFNLLFLKIVCNFNLLSKYVIDLEMYTPFFYTFLKIELFWCKYLIWQL